MKRPKDIRDRNLHIWSWQARFPESRNPDTDKLPVWHRSEKAVSSPSNFIKVFLKFCAMEKQNVRKISFSP